MNLTRKPVRFVHNLVLSHEDRSYSAEEFLHIPFIVHPEAIEETEKIEGRLQYPERPGLVQLFFDLFFVANLTTFNAIHEVNDGNTLKSYVGFFSIIWFTWLQVAIYDLRFGFDSGFERVCKALHFGVMTGIAIISPGYNISFADEDETQSSIQSFKSLSLILFVSRIVLCLQYSTALWHLRKTVHSKALLWHIGTLFSAAMIFLGLYFAFDGDSQARPLTGWYITVGVEAAVILILSLYSTTLNLRRTCIVERMGLLTLIILGEGVIGLCGAVQKLGSDQTFTANIVGCIICGLVIIYCAWIFYFDQTVGKRIGSIRQLFWVILHFPYHVSVLLVLEGVSQLSVWRKVLNYWEALDDGISNIASYPNEDTTQAMTAFVADLRTFAESFFHQLSIAHGNVKLEAPEAALNMTFDKLLSFSSNTSLLNDGAEFNSSTADAVSDVFTECAVFAAENLGIEAPEALARAAVTVSDTLDALISGTFSLVCVYFFFSAGTLLLFNVLLYLFGNRRKLRGDLIDVAFKVAFGSGLIIVACLELSTNDYLVSAFSSFESSNWVLPSLCLVYLLLVLVHNLLVLWMQRALKPAKAQAELNEATIKSSQGK